jgi:hypothetical protein
LGKRKEGGNRFLTTVAAHAVAQQRCLDAALLLKTLPKFADFRMSRIR